MSRELVTPATGPLAELLNEVEGGPMLPSVGGDSLAETVMRDGMTDSDDDSPPAIHLAGGTGGIRTLRDPSIEAEVRRRRAMRSVTLGAPPQNFPRQEPPAYQNPGYMQPMATPAPTPMTIQQGLIIGGVDFNHRAIVTNHGIIPLPEDVGQKVLGIALNAVRDYFAESMRQTMQTYGMTRKPIKRKKRKAVKRGANANLPSVP